MIGWAMTISRRIIRQETELLPQWDDFGGYLMLGLKGFLIALIASLPIIILAIPYSLITAMTDSDLAALITISSICFSCFSLIYGLLLALAIPASFGILAATDQVGEAINPRKLLELVRAAPAAYLLTLLGIIIAGFVGGLGAIACGVGIIFTQAYAMAIQGHLYGQAYNEATKASPQSAAY